MGENFFFIFWWQLQRLLPSCSILLLDLLSRLHSSIVDSFLHHQEKIYIFAGTHLLLGLQEIVPSVHTHAKKSNPVYQYGKHIFKMLKSPAHLKSPVLLSYLCRNLILLVCIYLTVSRVLVFSEAGKCQLKNTGSPLCTATASYYNYSNIIKGFYHVSNLCPYYGLFALSEQSVEDLVQNEVLEGYKAYFFPGFKSNIN